MEKIPTAKEHFKEHFKSGGYTNQNDLIGWGIEYAKLHLQAQAEAIGNSSIGEITSWNGNPYSGEGDDSLDLIKILNVYPLKKVV